MWETKKYIKTGIACLCTSLVFTSIPDKAHPLKYTKEYFNQLPLYVQQKILSEKRKLRIKDIVNFEGIRDNILLGYGLVVGLNGTGDNLKNSIFTLKELENFLGRLGMNTSGSGVKTKNTAAVTVTATLPPFSRNGSKIDVTISTLGDAKSLLGGTLIATPLLGANGKIYAVAQGNVSMDNLSNTGVNRESNNIQTNGHISGGAIIEKEVDFKLNELKKINLSLKNPDITTANNIAIAINSEMQNIIKNVETVRIQESTLTLTDHDAEVEKIVTEEQKIIKIPNKWVYAKAEDPGTVKVKIPREYKNKVLEFLERIGKLKVAVDSKAKVFINIKNGIISVNENVRIRKVAISHDNLTITIGGNEKPGRLKIVDNATSLEELVLGLNSIGTSTQDMHEILESMQKIGALQAEIIYG